MNETLVQNTEHDIDHEDCHDQQNRQILERFLKLLDGSLKTHGHAGGHAQLSNGFIDQLGCFSQRRALLKIERYCGRGNLPEMVDAERANRPRDRCHFIQRNEPSFRRSKINFLKRVGRSLILRLYFQNHRILVRRRINVRYLTVSVRTVQRILNLLGRYAERKRAVPINIDGDLRTGDQRSEEHTSELQSLTNLVCRLLLEKKKKKKKIKKIYKKILNNKKIIHYATHIIMFTIKINKDLK